MSNQPLTEIHSYGGHVRAFLWEMIATHVNNGGSKIITGESLVALCEKHWGRPVKDPETGYIKRNLAEMATSSNLPIVRIEGTRSGKYEVLAGVGANTVAQRKQEQPRVGSRSIQADKRPLEVAPPPPPSVSPGTHLEVLDVNANGDTCLVRTTGGQVFRCILERIVL